MNPVRSMAGKLYDVQDDPSNPSAKLINRITAITVRMTRINEGTASTIKEKIKRAITIAKTSRRKDNLTPPFSFAD